ncbi:uncharacterized protein PgNI_12238 [Pyricularia grisea]|uniref:Uncharacterized protein n=1 Tax=Pyricularia grisea TaxID=148305 RepID=A0A6P8AMK0_PYRGI|nr:uncharacterized protein PgNI_12238 [Pyricularia grisea]TLD03275.1 hypothetical protein PgNI_12238 [Pyricularia grisea]
MRRKSPFIANVRARRPPKQTNTVYKGGPIENRKARPTFVNFLQQALRWGGPRQWMLERLGGLENPVASEYVF